MENKLLFGESADVIFGGMDGLLSKDWTFETLPELEAAVKKAIKN